MTAGYTNISALLRECWVLRRLKLLSFLSAAARATNALLQRMTQARIEFNSSSLLESLLAAHRCCSTSIESLSALAGSFGVPGLSTLLQVQRHVLLMRGTWFTFECMQAGHRLCCGGP